MNIGRYTYIITPGHGYLKVPVEDIRSVFGWHCEDDWDTHSYGCSVADILATCPQTETHIYLEEDDAMTLFLDRAQQQGWDIDYISVLTNSEPCDAEFLSH